MSPPRSLSVGVAYEFKRMARQRPNLSKSAHVGWPTRPPQVNSKPATHKTIASVLVGRGLARYLNGAV
jgi:hypothetical protein